MSFGSVESAPCAHAVRVRRSACAFRCSAGKQTTRIATVCDDGFGVVPVMSWNFVYFELQCGSESSWCCSKHTMVAKDNDGHWKTPLVLRLSIEGKKGTIYLS